VGKGRARTPEEELEDLKRLRAKTPTGKSRTFMYGRFSLGTTLRVGQLFDLPNWPDTPPSHGA
jgi:hypothetical protein